MLRLNRAVLAVLVTTFVVFGLCTVLPANRSSPGFGTAHADPGFCGVRNDTVPAPGTGIMYVVRNKCDFTIRVRIWLTSFERWGSAHCKPIVPGGFGYFADAAIDQAWDPRGC